MEWQFDKERIIVQVDSVVERTMKMDLVWDWGTGVAYYGICRAYEVLGKEDYVIALKERVDELIELGVDDHWTVNKCAMGHVLLTLYEISGEDVYWDLIMSKIDYLQHHALRFGDRVLQHTVSSNNDFPGQAWADTLFMAAFFMLRVGIITNDKALIDDALHQYYWHIRYLQNRENGLFYHAYDDTQRTHLSGFYWGRANAWAAYTMSQVCARLPESYLYPKFMDVLGSLDEQLAALKHLQTDQGLWRTILDDPSSYEEVSASAGIAAAMAVKHNPLHLKYIQKALDGVMANITDDGRVLNVSAGTAVMTDRNGYCDISREWLHGWGQGLALTFLAEVMGRY